MASATTVHEFELFHGIALTKLVRSDHPITLRMIETNTSEAWSAYTLDGQTTLYIKHSTALKKSVRDKFITWPFSFSPNDIHKIAELSEQRSVHVALVCGNKTMQIKEMQICLIDPDQVKQLIDVGGSDAQSIRVKYIPGKSLRVTGSISAKELIVARNKFDSWRVPGS